MEGKEDWWSKKKEGMITGRRRATGSLSLFVLVFLSLLVQRAVRVCVYVCAWAGAPWLGSESEGSEDDSQCVYLHSLVSLSLCLCVCVCR